jgi:hypothetical protein
MNCLHPLKHGVVSSNPTQGMDVCVRLFYVCAILYVGSGLERGSSPSSESYRLCVGLRNCKSGQGLKKDCRVIYKYIQFDYGVGRNTYFRNVGNSTNNNTI